MATLSDYVNSPEVKPIYRGRYSSNGYFIFWANQLLEELQDRGFLSDYIKEVGTIVTNEVWIAKPSDLIDVEKIYCGVDNNQVFRFEDVNGKFKLIDSVFDISEETFEDAGTLSAFTVNSITTDLEDKAKDVYKNYLFYVLLGNLAGNGYIIGSNDASVTIGPVTTMKLNLLHNLSSALTAPDVTDAQLIPPEYYVIIKYRASIPVITTINDEIPLPDGCEGRLFPTWLRWCCEREAMATSKDTIYWEDQKNKILYSIQSKRAGRVNPARGRRLVGMQSSVNLQKTHPDWLTVYNVDA